MEKFTLPDLAYSFDALEPYVDAKTMELHYTKHHQSYIDKLNAAMEGESWFEGKSLEEIVATWEQAPQGKKDVVRNHGGGHINHTFFWKILVPGGSRELSQELQTKIGEDLESMETLKVQLFEAATGHFGSGWAWLVLNKESKLEILSTPNQNSPLMYGYKPLLGIDVWEHAYYLKYQNRRPEYLEAIWLSLIHI